MKVLFCLALGLLAVAANPMESGIPAAEPEYLDMLLKEERYEEFSYLMDIDDPKFVHSTGEKRSRQESMMNIDLTEGDLMLSTQDREEARQGIRFAKYPRSKWQNRVVHYTISSNFNNNERPKVQSGIDIWNRDVGNCIKFVPRQSQADFVMFFPGEGCWAHIGRNGGQQSISLDRNGGCLYDNVIVHEMGHCVGFAHEQNRSDRDDFIEMLWNNIPERWKREYQKTNPNDYGLQGRYDYYSIMHYPVNAPGTNKPAFRVKQSGIDGSRIGNGKGFTQQDKNDICELYR